MSVTYGNRCRCNCHSFWASWGVLRRTAAIFRRPYHTRCATKSDRSCKSQRRCFCTFSVCETRFCSLSRTSHLGYRHAAVICPGPPPPPPPPSCYDPSLPPSCLLKGCRFTFLNCLSVECMLSAGWYHGARACCASCHRIDCLCLRTGSSMVFRSCHYEYNRTTVCSVQSCTSHFLPRKCLMVLFLLR